LKNDGIIFSFSGPLSQVILEGIGETMRKKMKMESTALGTITARLMMTGFELKILNG
jgi:hypothetical protein